MNVSMKAMFSAVLVLVSVVLLVNRVPVRAAASETDDRIESSARDSYVFKTYLKNDAIQIESNDGIVALTGTVAEVSHKALAQEAVASLPGVISVDNRLEVKDEGVTENSDAWIGMKVKTALLFHRNVSAVTEVSTRDGIVTLKGEAASQAQKDLATELARDVEGVKDVKNEMTVAMAPGSNPGTGKTTGDKMEAISESIDDASITALVKMTLLYHRSTSALNTTVATNRGVVTVGGKARNAAEKDLVTKYAQDVRGVNEVVNTMTIEATPSTTK